LSELINIFDECTIDELIDTFDKCIIDVLIDTFDECAIDKSSLCVTINELITMINDESINVDALNEIFSRMIRNLTKRQFDDDRREN
jgi:inosine/xanthosine triphosphate pyrophosphatase family protein